MTTYPYVQLSATGLTDFVLIPENGIVGQKLDLGDAVVREVAQDAPDADGSIDTTAYVGPRNVTLSAIVDGAAADVWATVQRLRSFTHPRQRPTLYVQQSATAPLQQITLRRSQWSDPIGDDARDTADPTNESQRSVTVQWVAPYGIIESAEQHSAVANASASGLEGGRTYDHTFDTTYTGGTVIGQTTVTNAGSADAYPILRCYGPCTDPVITNVTAGKSLVFSGLTVNAGEYLEIDTRAKTIYYLGDPSNSRYSYLVFASSAWWSLAPGDNVLRFLPATSSVPSNCTLIYRDAWL